MGCGGVRKVFDSPGLLWWWAVTTMAMTVVVMQEVWELHGRRRLQRRQDGGVVAVDVDVDVDWRW